MGGGLAGLTAAQALCQLFDEVRPLSVLGGAAMRPQRTCSVLAFRLHSWSEMPSRAAMMGMEALTPSSRTSKR